MPSSRQNPSSASIPQEYSHQAHADLRLWSHPILLSAIATTPPVYSLPTLDPPTSRFSSNRLKLPQDRLSAKSPTPPQSLTATPTVAHVKLRMKSPPHRPRNWDISQSVERSTLKNPFASRRPHKNKKSLLGKAINLKHALTITRMVDQEHLLASASRHVSMEPQWVFDKVEL